VFNIKLEGEQLRLIIPGEEPMSIKHCRFFAEMGGFVAEAQHRMVPSIFSLVRMVEYYLFK
jgi:hypothetical protein